MPKTLGLFKTCPVRFLFDIEQNWQKALMDVKLKETQLLKVKCHQGQILLHRKTFVQGNNSDFIRCYGIMVL